MLYFALVVCVGLLGYILFIVPTQWLKVERIQHRCGIQQRVLQLSDIHVEKNRISQRKLRKVIAAERPDWIALTGDFTERAKHLPKLERILGTITAFGIPCYAVLGNHDYRLSMQEREALFAMLQRLGVTLLRNESVAMPGFRIVGIDDYCTSHHQLQASFREVEQNMPAIVLTHDPNIVLRMEDYPFTYLMAGHFHGMQFRVPFLYRYIKKGRLAARGITEGLHSAPYGAGAYYISKGMGQAGPNARFLIRSEVTVHQLS